MLATARRPVKSADYMAFGVAWMGCAPTLALPRLLCTDVA